MSSKSVVITVKVSRIVANKVASAAKRQSRTKSEVVREALERGLVASPDESVWDLIGDLAGSFEGPGDLSHNKKHMRGFGS